MLGVAARFRITPVVKDLVNMWKSDTGAAKREDKVRIMTTIFNFVIFIYTLIPFL